MGQCTSVNRVIGPLGGRRGKPTESHNMETIASRKPIDPIGSELSVFAKAPRVGPTPSTTEIAAMIKGGKPGDMDKLDV